MRKWRLRTVFGATGALLGLTLPAAAPAGGQTFINWPEYLYSNNHSSDNAVATAITTLNAPGLHLAWKYDPPPGPLAGLKGFQASPVIYNGVVYIGAKNGYFYAISEATGTVIWSRDIGYVPKLTCSWSQGFTATATVKLDPATGDPTVYAYGANGYLYAMNASDGSNVWAPALVYTPSTTKNNYYAWASPLVYGGSIYVGLSSSCDVPLIRAGLDKFSQKTGALETTYWTTPMGTTGASIWSSPATEDNSVYITTGNGPNGSLGFSVIKLNLALTKREGIWTVPVKDRITDSDFGGSPGFWTASIGGTTATLVGACNKNGTFYAFNINDLKAGPVWSQNIGVSANARMGECLAAPIWDGTHLYLATNGTTIGGTTYNGSVMQVNPATGAVIWQTGLTGAIMGTPALDGSGVLAAASFSSKTNQNGVWLLNASTGAILKEFSYGRAQTFGQPAFADGYLLIASTLKGLRAYSAG